MLQNKTMIEAIVDEANHDGGGAGWHFKYQPKNGGPIVSKPILTYGSDWVKLDLEEDGSGPFFVHERQMAWAMVDWRCEDLPPYTGQPLSGGKTIS